MIGYPARVAGTWPEPADGQQGDEAQEPQPG